MKTCKKIISILLLMIITISLLPNFVQGLTPTEYVELKIDETKQIHTNIRKKGQLQEIEAKYIYYELNNTKYPAYVMDYGYRNYEGVDKKGSYVVDLDDTYINQYVWRAIANGYPNKTPKELGVDTKAEAYFVTMEAIKCILGSSNINDYEYIDTTIVNTNEKDMIKSIENIMRAGYKQIPLRRMTTLTSYAKGQLNKEGKYYSQTYAVESDKEIESFKIEEMNGFPKGSFIANENGEEQALFEGKGECKAEFKVMIPKENIKENIEGNIIIKAKCKNYPVCIGKPRKEYLQEYMLTYEQSEEFVTEASLNVNTNTGNIQITKEDSKTQAPLEGVKFELLKFDGSKVGEASTDEKGLATFINLYPGNYQLQEISTGENYILNSKPIDVKVIYNETAEVPITNDYKLGSLKITQLDMQTNMPIENSEFELLDLEGNKIAIGKTNQNGIIFLPNLRIGNYKLRELKPAAEYIHNTNMIDVKVEYNKTTAKDFQSKCKKGSFSLKKVDEENYNKTLKDIVFDLYSNNLNKVIGSYRTNEKGEINVNDLKIGDYRLIEKTTERGYKLSAPLNLLINWNKNEEIISIGEKIKGKIQITQKNIKEENVLTGAIIEIYTDEDVLVDTITIGENGKAESKELNYGKYYVKEKRSSSEEYQVNPKKYYATIQKDGEVVEITMESIKSKTETNTDQEINKPEENKKPETNTDQEVNKPEEGKKPETNTDQEINKPEENKKPETNTDQEVNKPEEGKKPETNTNQETNRPEEDKKPEINANQETNKPEENKKPVINNKVNNTKVESNNKKPEKDKIQTVKKLPKTGF